MARGIDTRKCIRAPATEQEMLPTGHDYLQADLELYSRDGDTDTGKETKKVDAAQWKRCVKNQVLELGDREPDNHEIHKWDKWSPGDVGTYAASSISEEDEDNTEEERDRAGSAHRPPRCTTSEQLSSSVAAQSARLRRILKTIRTTARGARAELRRSAKSTRRSRCRLAAVRRAWLGVWARRLAGQGFVDRRRAGVNSMGPVRCSPVWFNASRASTARERPELLSRKACGNASTRPSAPTRPSTTSRWWTRALELGHGHGEKKSHAGMALWSGREPRRAQCSGTLCWTMRGDRFARNGNGWGMA